MTWTKAPLGDLLSYIGKGVAPKYTDDSSAADSVMVLGQKCVRNQSVIYAEARFHDEAAKSFKPEKVVCPGDILVNATGVGSAGRVAQVVDAPSRKCITDGHVITLRSSDRIDPVYLGYFVKSKQVLIEQMAEGSTGQTEMNRTRLQNEILVTFPESNEDQKAIAKFGLAIDRKIATNAKLNGYLEELLLAKYDKLFPVNADFTGILSDVGTVIGGATPSKKRSEYYCSNGIGWITPRDLSNTSDKFIAHGADDITDEGYASCSAKLLPKGSVLFSSRAPIGYVAIATNEVATNQGFKSVVPKEEIGTAFVYCFLVRNKQRIADMGAGTTFPEVSGKMMKSVELAVPEQSLCAEFNVFAEPILKQQETLERENRDLAALRNALLPKLMSGEIDVTKVDLAQLNSHLA